LPHSYRGGSAARTRRKRGWSQASTRHDATALDQFDRQWSFQVDNKSGMPVTPLHADFQAPWMPDPQYMRVNPRNPAELYIDLEAMFRDLRVALARYHRGAIQWAKEHKVDAPTLGNYSDTVRNGYGGPPRAIEPVVAAVQRNRWILGLTDVIDERLRPFVEVRATEDSFMAEYDFHDADDQTFEMSRERTEGLAARLAHVDVTDMKDEIESALDEIDAGVQAGVGDAEGEEDIHRLLGLDSLPREEDEPTSPKREAIRKPVPPKHGPPLPVRGKRTLAQQKAAQRGNRRSMADGAVPAIAGGGIEDDG